jgi:ankyrin repeat protein
MSRSQWLVSIVGVSVLVAGVRLGARADGSGDTRLADALMRGDAASVPSLVKAGADVNGAQGDGMTPLLWAAQRNDLEVAKALLAAGASVKATTRLGGYTPLFLASRNGNAALVDLLVGAGADAKSVTPAGTTPLMFAAASGNADTINLLLDNGADVNAREKTYGETALMFAAANDRVFAIRALVARGAHLGAWSNVVDVAAQATAARGAGAGAGAGRGAGGPGRAGATPADAATSAQGPRGQGAGRGGAAAADGANGAGASGLAPAGQAGAGGGGQGGGANGAGDDSRPTGIDFQGGLTPLLFAIRQGHTSAVHALVEAGADVNQVSPGDKTSPLLMAAINGHFDIAIFLLGRGANPDLASTANATPLYAAIGVTYAPHAFYPQPTAAEEKTSLLQMMTALLEHGANPNLKLSKKLWYTGYNFDQSGVDAKGSTPFWRAAQAADVDAMKLLVSYGADPDITSDAAVLGFRQPNGRATEGANGAGATAPPKLAAKVLDGVSALQMASGAGFDGNFQVIAPGGFMPALKYLIEDLHQDVNAADYRGFTPVHNAAFRGDNAMIQYLVSKGADPKVETKAGDTAIDMANGPVQRIQPFPETIKLLESMGVINHHRCVSCGGSGGH